jgi:hypothetical protein
LRTSLRFDTDSGAIWLGDRYMVLMLLMQTSALQTLR